MGCCGEPADQPNSHVGGNRSIALDSSKPVIQQPSAQPALQWQEKPSFQAPNIATPAPVLQYNQNTAESWEQQGAQYDPYAPSRTASPSAATATLVNGSINGHGFAPSASPAPFGQTHSPPPLAHPGAAYSPSTSMTVTSRKAVSPGGQHPPFVPPSDEGKLSVSIDFGMHGSSL